MEIIKSLKWTITALVIGLTIALVYNIVYYLTTVLLVDKTLASNLANTATFIIIVGFVLDLIVQARYSLEKQRQDKDLESDLKPKGVNTVYPEKRNEDNIALFKQIDNREAIREPDARPLYERIYDSIENKPQVNTDWSAEK